MRFHNDLDDVLSTPSKVRALRALLRYPGKTFTGRELASLAGTSPPRAIKALHVLAASGLVSVRRLGPSQAWSLEERHYLVPGLRSLFEREGQARCQLEALIVDRLSRQGVRRAILFGSVARGTEGPTSDVDLYVEVTDERSRARLEPHLAALRTEVFRRFGNPLAPLVYTTGEAPRAALPLMKAIRSEGTVLVGG